jgi:chorismate synthase
VKSRGYRKTGSPKSVLTKTKFVVPASFDKIGSKVSDMLRFLTAGESHGKCLTAILEGLPRGIDIDLDFINLQLHRRQLGYGRGGRMKIERDEIEITSGVRHGSSIGSPISFTIRNKDWDHWQAAMSVEPVPKDSSIRSVTRARPGHADLAGALKYQTHDIRDVLERASARETAARVAIGAFCRLFLARFGVRIGSHVIAIGKEHVAQEFEQPTIEQVLDMNPESALHCTDPYAEKRMIALIDETTKAGDTLGGSVEVLASPVPPGLGSHIQWDCKLDGQIAQAMMSIPSVKAVEIGAGVACTAEPGSAVHDEIFYDSDAKRFFRKTNRAGGIEGGLSNGSDIRVQVHLKPIPTLRKPLRSIDVESKQPVEAVVERSDTCVVPAAGVIAEAMMGIVLANSFLEKFGGDSINELEKNYANFVHLLDEY